jgi:hypothetical protein
MHYLKTNVQQRFESEKKVENTKAFMDYVSDVSDVNLFYNVDISIEIYLILKDQEYVLQIYYL